MTKKGKSGTVSSVQGDGQERKYGKPGDLDKLVRETMKEESPSSHDKVKDMAQSAVEFWAPIMTLDGWTFKVESMEHGNLMSGGDTCVGGMESAHGTKVSRIVVSGDYEYDHPGALEGGIENVVRHELGHVVMNELGFFEVKEIVLGNGKKSVRADWLKTFTESVLDRMAVMVGRAYDKGLKDGIHTPDRTT